MRAILAGLTLMTLAGCGIDETKFIPEYTQLYCEKYMECSDQAVRVFDGIDDIDQCLGTVGPQIEAEVGYCDYNPKAAKKCIKAMEAMTCPGEGQFLDDVVPLDCSEAVNACNPPAEDTKDDPTGGTEPTETTTGGTGG